MSNQPTKKRKARKSPLRPSCHACKGRKGPIKQCGYIRFNRNKYYRCNKKYCADCAGESRKTGFEKGYFQCPCCMKECRRSRCQNSKFMSMEKTDDMNLEDDEGEDDNSDGDCNKEEKKQENTPNSDTAKEVSVVDKKSDENVISTIASSNIGSQPVSPLPLVIPHSLQYLPPEKPKEKVIDSQPGVPSQPPPPPPPPPPLSTSKSSDAPIFTDIIFRSSSNTFRLNLRSLKPTCSLTTLTLAILEYFKPRSDTNLSLSYDCARAKRKIGIIQNSDMNSFLQSQPYEQDDRMRLYTTPILVNHKTQHQEPNPNLSYIL